MCYQAKDQQESTTSMPLCTSYTAGNSKCFSVQRLWETLDHGTEQVSTTCQRQTPYSLPTNVDTNAGLSALCQWGTEWELLGQGQPHLMHTDISLVPSTRVSFSSGNPCILDHSLSSSHLEQNSGGAYKTRTTQCDKVGPGETGRPTFLHVLSYKLCQGPRSDIGHSCLPVQPKGHTCNSAIILSPSSSSSSFAADATACPALRDSAWSSLVALDCAICPASSVLSYKGMRKHRQTT